MAWQPIETAPKDGTHIEVRGQHGDPYEVWWKPDGTSWVGRQLEVTGIWAATVGGWFEPVEVNMWRPIFAVPPDTQPAPAPAGERFRESDERSGFPVKWAAEWYDYEPPVNNRLPETE